MAPAICLVLGAAVGFSILEPGNFGIVIVPAALLLLGLFLLQGDRHTRVLRIGAFLLGGGLGGAAPLLALVIRIGNICDGTAHPTPHPGGGFSYECYSVETLWALIPYGALVCLGGLMLFRSRRQRAASTTA